MNELYADVFSKVYGFHTIGLRYFNVFGPKQNPNNPYAAVIPIFCKQYIQGIQPTINGDGETSRDFTFVENAIQANVKAMLSKFDCIGDKQTISLSHNVFNVACGDQISLNSLVSLLQEISSSNLGAVYGVERSGDVRHSRASIRKLQEFCGYSPTVRFENGLRIVYAWYLDMSNQQG